MSKMWQIIYQILNYYLRGNFSTFACFFVDSMETIRRLCRAHTDRRGHIGPCLGLFPGDDTDADGGHQQQGRVRSGCRYHHRSKQRQRCYATSVKAGSLHWSASRNRLSYAVPQVHHKCDRSRQTDTCLLYTSPSPRD